MTWYSTLLQIGFFLGYFLVEVLIIQWHSNVEGVATVLSKYLSSIFYNDSPLLRSASLFAGIVGLVLYAVCLKNLDEPREWKEWKTSWKKIRYGKKQNRSVPWRLNSDELENRYVKKHEKPESQNPGITPLLNR